MKSFIILLGACFLLLTTVNGANAAIIYSEDFNASDGGYTHGGVLDEWEWGTAVNVTGTPIAWGTDLDSNYDNFSNQWLRSVPIDLSLLDPTQPITLAFDYWSHTETNWDYSYFDYSIDGGSNWTNYNTVTGPSVTPPWTLNYTYDISSLAGATLDLRWRLTSDISGTRRGLYIDNVTIDGTPIPEPATMLLLGTGLSALGLGASRRRKKS